MRSDGDMQRVLVTGGSGFIGAALCRRLVQQSGARVLNIDCLTYAADSRRLEAIAGEARYHHAEIDIADRKAVVAAVDGFKPDTIIHLAAETHVDRSIDASARFVETNVVGTHALLEAARRYWSGLSPREADRFRFLHVSTDEVYGSVSPGDYFTETSRYEPTSPYSASKAAADHLAQAWHATYGLPVMISNCSNNYGPYQFPEKLIPLMILKALHGEALPVYGDGGNVRDWIHVEDHAEAIACIALRGRPGEKYNVGARCERTNIDIVQRICAILDAERPGARPRAELISFVADRPGHDRRYAIDPDKVEREIGWRPRISFERGLRDTVLWYLANERWWGPLSSRYQGERLGRASRPRSEDGVPLQ